MAGHCDIWEKHAKFSRAIDDINNFAQSDVISEELIDYLQSNFEDRDFGSVETKLEYMKSEVVPLLDAINFAYDYIKGIKE